MAATRPLQQPSPPGRPLVGALASRYSPSPMKPANTNTFRASAAVGRAIAGLAAGYLVVTTVFAQAGAPAPANPPAAASLRRSLRRRLASTRPCCDAPRISPTSRRSRRCATRTGSMPGPRTPRMPAARRARAGDRRQGALRPARRVLDDHRREVTPASCSGRCPAATSS